jgi:hypothetical protein
MEPNLERSRAAREALGTAFRVTASAAPNLPLEPAAFELVLLLDVAHYLDDATLEATLARARVCLRPSGALLMRDTVKSRLFSLERGVETLIMWRRGQATHFRAARELTAAVVRAGFAVEAEPIPGREETWFVARRA